MATVTPYPSPDTPPPLNDPYNYPPKGADGLTLLRTAMEAKLLFSKGKTKKPGRLWTLPGLQLVGGIGIEPMAPAV